MKGAPDIAVVVCTLGRCLAAVLSQKIARRSFEVAVVLSAADPGAAGRVRPLVRGRAAIVDEPVRGLSRARNRGIAATRAPVVAFTDDDVIVDPGWLAALLGAFGDPAVDGAFGSTRGPGGLPFPLCEQTDLTPAVAASPEALWRLGHGNNMAWRRQVFARIGGFDEQLGAGTRNAAGEDTDLLYRALAAGMRVAYQPRAGALHLPDLSAAGPLERLKGYDVGAAAFAAKHAAAGDPLPALLVLRRMAPRAAIVRPYLPLSPAALWHDQRDELFRWAAMAGAAVTNFVRYLPLRGARGPGTP